MYAQIEKLKDNISKAIANSVTQKKSNVKQGFGVVDNRQSYPWQIEGDSSKVVQRESDPKPYNVFPYWANKINLVGEYHGEVPMAVEQKFWDVYGIRVIYEAMGIIYGEGDEEEHVPVDDHRMKFFMFAAAYVQILDEIKTHNYEQFNKLKELQSGMRIERNSIEVDLDIEMVLSLIDNFDNGEDSLFEKPFREAKVEIGQTRKKLKEIINKVSSDPNVFESDVHETEPYRVFGEIRSKRMIENILGMTGKLGNRTIIKLGETHIKHIKAAKGVEAMLATHGVKVFSRDQYQEHLPHFFEKKD